MRTQLFWTDHLSEPGGALHWKIPGSALVWCLIWVLAGCTTSGNAPVESRAEPPSRSINQHVVERGDTLYSIAWRYRQDFRQIAEINGITPPYTIYVGQKIRLSGAARPQPATTQSAGTSATPSKSSEKSRSKVPSPARNRNLPDAVGNWRWPVQGKIVEPFGRDSRTRGITLDTSMRREVTAVADGVVVYAGAGLRGYGNFMIVKHSDLFLSAYAYNSELIVAEGEQVKMGQKIAVSGEDVDGAPRLYFELRKDGKPVDPVRYLPRR